MLKEAIMITRDVPKAAALPADPMKRVEFVFNTWAHTVPEGVDWHECLTREYWQKNTEKFRDGSSVVIHSSDHRIQFEMLVLHTNAATDPMTLELAFRPIWPVDLVLPAPERQRAARYEIREAPGAAGFNVIDKRTGKPLSDNPSPRNVAAELAASLQRAADQVEGEMAADEFIRSQRAAVSRAGSVEAIKRRPRGRPRKPAHAPDDAAPPLAAQGEI